MRNYFSQCESRNISIQNFLRILPLMEKWVFEDVPIENEKWNWSGIERMLKSTQGLKWSFKTMSYKYRKLVISLEILFIQKLISYLLIVQVLLNMTNFVFTTTEKKQLFSI